MNTIQVTFDLPQEVVDEARSIGILDNVRVTRMLESEIERQRKIDRFFSVLDEIQSDPDRLTPEEIDEEIRLYREERHRHRQQAKAEAQ